jgi:hypothetical protein
VNACSSMNTPIWMPADSSALTLRCRVKHLDHLSQGKQGARGLHHWPNSGIEIARERHKKHCAAEACGGQSACHRRGWLSWIPSLREIARRRTPGALRRQFFHWDAQEYRAPHIKVACIFNTYGPRTRSNDGRCRASSCRPLTNQQITVFGHG